MIKTNYKNIFNLNKEKLDSIDKDLYPFLIEWQGDSSHISTNTSGSTGIPKKISLQKTHMIVSGNASIDFFNLKTGDTFLICLPIKTIGGKMMLIRSILSKGKIIIIKPSKNPIKELDVNIDFCALTPFQLAKSLEENLNINYIDKLIIGGGPVNESLVEKIENIKTKCYHTYGMTETISHIAVKKLNYTKKKLDFKCLNHVQISVNNKGNLIIKSKDIGIESMTTNDIVKITGNESFKWIGRSDNIVNSGGVKISPERIEYELSKKLPFDSFFITSIYDSKLVEKLIIISKSTTTITTIRSAIESIKDNILRPKDIYLIDEFKYTISNKINRKLTKEKALIYKPFPK